MLLIGVLISLGFSSEADTTITNASSSAEALAGDVIQFLDGSVLHGDLQEIDTTNGIRWGHPEALKSIIFRSTNVDSIRFDNAKAVGGAEKATGRFRLRNGDEFFGNLTALDEKEAELETWFGKSMKVRREAMESLTFVASKLGLIYEGPTAGDGWNFGRGAQPWQYRDGALVTSGIGTVGRNFKLPAACIVEFDLSWTGPMFEIVMPFYTDTIDRFDYGTSSYMFHFRQNSVDLQRVHSELGVMRLGQTVAIPNPRKKSSYHFEIRASKEQSTLALLVDGNLLRKWKDDAGFTAKGGGIVFFSQHDGPNIKISNIKVTEWDGRFEDDRPTESKDSDDILHLANHDRVRGQLGGLRDGKLTFNVPGTALQIPLVRISQIFFKNGTTNALVRAPWEIRALFAGGEKLSFELQKWDKQAISGVSPNLGKVSFNAGSIRQVQFNLNETKPLPDIASSDEWDTDMLPDAGFTSVNDRDDAILFRNGDVLYGALENFAPKTNLSWRRLDAREPIQFKTAGLSEIRFRQQANQLASANCRIDLGNADQLEGNIVSVDANKIAFDTWYAGRMNFVRNRVQMIVPIQVNRTVVFDGITGLDGWTMGKVTAVPDGGEWKYKNGAFYASKAASIARDLKLPDRASIQFDLSWKGSLQAAVALYTAHLQPVNLATKDSDADFGGFYSLQLNNFSTGLMMVKKDAPLKYLWQQPIPALSQNNNARIEIRVDKRRRMITMMVNGVVFKQAVDTDEFAGTGTAMRFVHQGAGSLKLSNLRIVEWDGQFEDRMTNNKGNEDLTKLRNGDRVLGNVLSYSDNKFIVSSEGSKLEVPFERVKQIELAGAKIDPPRQDSSEVIGYFKNGAILNFRIESWDDKGIAAKSPNFGQTIINPAAFTRIRFKDGTEKGPPLLFDPVRQPELP